MLHSAVELGAPLEFVEAMVRTFPEGFKVKDWKGRLVGDVVLYNETKEFLSRALRGEGNDVTNNVMADQSLISEQDKLQILQQMEKVSGEISSLKKSCQRLSKEIDLLIAELKAT
jgi:hypothetical protein